MTSSEARFYRDILDETGMSLYANSFPTKTVSRIFLFKSSFPPAKPNYEKNSEDSKR